MKHLIATMLTVVHYLTVWGQMNADRQFLQTKSKSHLYYVDLKDEEGWVYAMGYYMDVAGKGYGIMNTDTLQRQTDGIYTGRYSRIIREKDQLYLVSTFRKTRKLRLDTVSNPNLANNNLNNAYYLGHYFAMSKELEKEYPLNNHDFRGGFYTWKALPNKEKEMNYMEFRKFADARLKEVKDSTSAMQDKYVSLTDYIIQNIRLMEYAVLKDSLAQLPAEYAGRSRYYAKVINTIAEYQPEYFFRLAEDLPRHQDLIFMCAVRNKQALMGLKNVEGHDEMKKAFLKEIKSDRAAPFFAFGALSLSAAAIVMLIIVL